MYEHRSDNILGRRAYLARQARHAGGAALLFLVALAIGAVGYHRLAGTNWIESIYGAAMILTGMGPAVELTTDGARLFVSAYAVFAAVVFLGAASLVVAPALHRLLHTLHVDDGRDA